jgi:hypothetical protein
MARDPGVSLNWCHSLEQLRVAVDTGLKMSEIKLGADLILALSGKA